MVGRREIGDGRWELAVGPRRRGHGRSEVHAARLQGRADPVALSFLPVASLMMLDFAPESPLHGWHSWGCCNRQKAWVGGVGIGAARRQGAVQPGTRRIHCDHR